MSSPNYISYAGTNWKVAFQFGKEYNFWAQTSLDRLTNFNLFAFLRYLRDNTVFFVEGDYLIGIQTGFRYITGESKIIVNEFNLEQTDRNYTNSDEKTIIIIL